VKLYEHKDFEGDFVTVTGSRCVNLDNGDGKYCDSNDECTQISFNDRTSSVDTHGTCVRVYQHKDCSGNFISF